MPKPRIEIIEINVADACNFACVGCTNYSNYKVSGLADWEDVKVQLTALKERLDIGTVSFIGGEPLLHPNIREFITGARELFPNSLIQLTTNGYLLSKNIDILDVLDSINGALLKISIHRPHDQWFKDLKEEIENYFEWHLNPDHRGWWTNQNYLNLQYSMEMIFVKTFKDDFSNMMPYNNDADRAFNETCTQKLCPVLRDGKLYKCSTTSELRRVLRDWNRLDIPEWQPYLDIGLDLNCSDEELQAWADNYGKPAWHCSMCPIDADQPYVEHFKNVELKRTRDVR